MAMNNSIAEVHLELVSEWSEKNLTLTPDDITFGSNKKVWWRGACGHEWQASVKARSNGEKCPICSGARVIAGINDLTTLEPLLVKQWSKKNKIKPTEVSIGSHKKVIWKCKLGHEWIATIKSRIINKTGCPYCSHNKVLAGFSDFATLLPDIAAEWSDRNYPVLPTQVTVFANRKAWWKCKDCGREWNTLISTRSGGSKCPYCSGYIFLKGFNDLQTTRPEIASEWSEKNLSLKPDEVNAKPRENVWWRCSKCGNEWKSVINARVKGTVSLLAKWLPSVNASNGETVGKAKRVARYLGMTDAVYRKTLVELRKKIRIIENNLREKDYSVDYSKQPSKAMFKYRKAFLRNDGERYNEFMEAVTTGNKQLHADTLAPYEIVRSALNANHWGFNTHLSAGEKASLNASWESLPNFCDERNALAVVDTSGTMYCYNNALSAAGAMSLGLYFGERNTGIFHNHFIEFSPWPQLIEIKGEKLC